LIIEPIKPQPTFGYSNILKTEWLKGNLKTVKKGFYGDDLTKKTVSLEHLKPASQGGKTILPNLVLASKRMNQARGCDDLKKYATKKGIVEYLVQFIGVKTKRFDGDEYIANILKTLKTLDINL
jgi:hypothetical protein